jgi:hypothetical protein
MTIYWNPIGDVEPDPTVQCEYYEVYENSTKLGDPAEPAEYGMPDSIGGIAPDIVREYVENNTERTAYEADRRTEYVRGTPE